MLKAMESLEGRTSSPSPLPHPRHAPSFLKGLREYTSKLFKKQLKDVNM
jgi:hypothetical protein